MYIGCIRARWAWIFPIFLLLSLCAFAEEAPPPPAQQPTVSEYTRGMIDGKYYLLRLKWGDKSAWYAYNDGYTRFLSFCNALTPCEEKTRTITWPELKEACAASDKVPPVVFLYADETFALTDEEAGILRGYLQQGGFLVIDGRPDPAVKEKVTKAMVSVLPATPLKALPAKHALNTYLFTLASPGVGMNILEKRNYGIEDNGRLVVFYTPGNFFGLFASHKQDSQAYVTAQYQMMANVYFYTLTKGCPEELPKLPQAQHAANDEPGEK